MTHEEAKLILQACGKADAANPQFIEAMALAKNDPELAAWLAREQKFDSLVSDGLKKIEIPIQLKSQILSRARKPEPRSNPQTESPASAWWRNLFAFNSPVAWATAIILVLACLAIFLKKQTHAWQFADFSTHMVSAAVNDPKHVDTEMNDINQAVAWLAQHHGESKFILPVALNGANGLMGCRVLDWHGQKISMLCYGLKNSGHVDLFVAEAKDFSDAPPVDNPQFVVNSGMPTASWSHDSVTYLAVGHGNQADLEKIFSPEKSALARQKSYCSRINF